MPLRSSSVNLKKKKKNQLFIFPKKKKIALSFLTQIKLILPIAYSRADIITRKVNNQRNK